MYTENYNPASVSPPGVAVLRSGSRVWYFDLAPARRMGCMGCEAKACTHCPRLSGAPVGAQVGHAVGTGSGATAAILTAAGVSGPAAPIVAAVGAIGALIAGFFGKGCGQACIQSATLEQVPQVAMRDLHAVALQQPGAISAGQFQAAWQQTLAQGIQSLQNLLAGGDKRAQGGIDNLQKSMDYAGFVAGLPATPTRALDITQAQSVFEVDSKNWEPGTVQAGNNLALQLLQQIAESSAASGGIASTVTALQQSTGLSLPALLAGGAVVAYLIFRKG